MTLTNFPHDPLLDLDPWVGQRQATFRFELYDGVTGLEKGELHPIRGASLTHDSTRTIPRTLTMQLGTVDTELVDPITDRVRVFMAFPSGAEYPLGVYMPNDSSNQIFTSGKIGNVSLSDEMFLVDQEISAGISSVDAYGNQYLTSLMISYVLDELPITYHLEPTPFESAESWSIGTTRGQILESLSVSGDYFSPWFDNTGVLRFIRTFNPASKIPDFDFDSGNKVIREPVVVSNDLISAPNRFIVTSTIPDDLDTEIVGTYDISPLAPNSIARRGFVVPKTEDLPLTNASQAQAVAQGLAERHVAYEQVALTTAPDPRHDGYNVIQWQGSLWLELAWTMSLEEGGSMSHLLRKSYGPE